MTPNPDDTSEPNEPEGEFPRYEYTLAEFKDHLKALENRRMEDAADDEGAFIRNVLRIKDYFSEFYEQDEATQKLSTFVVAYTHITGHQNDYDEGMLGIKTSGGMMVSDALQYAVHWYFTSRDRSDWGSDAEAIVLIKSKANEWTGKEG